MTQKQLLKEKVACFQPHCPCSGFWAPGVNSLQPFCCLLSSVLFANRSGHASAFPRLFLSQRNHAMCRCFELCSPQGYLAVRTELQEGWGLTTLHLQTLCESVSRGYQCLLWRKTSGSARLLLLCSESLRSQSFHTLTCSSYLLMEPHRQKTPRN